MIYIIFQTQNIKRSSFLWYRLISIYSTPGFNSLFFWCIGDSNDNACQIYQTFKTDAYQGLMFMGISCQFYRAIPDQTNCALLTMFVMNLSNGSPDGATAKVSSLNHMVQASLCRVHPSVCQPRWLSGLRRSRVHSLMIARRSLCPEKLGSNPGQGSKGINLSGWHGLDMSVTVAKRR